MGTVEDKNPFIVNGFPVPYSSALKPFGKIPKKAPGVAVKQEDEKQHIDMQPSTSQETQPSTSKSKIDQSKICEIDMSLYETPKPAKQRIEQTPPMKNQPTPNKNPRRDSSNRDKRDRGKRKHDEAVVEKMPLDQIFGEMSREEKRRRHDKRRSEIEPSPPRGAGIFEGEMTEEWMHTRQPDERMINDFLNRDTILEYLLGWKMGYNNRLESWDKLGFERKTEQDLLEMGVNKFRPGAIASPSEQKPLMEQKPKVPKGPKTPPGSPGKSAPPRGPKTPPPNLPSNLQNEAEADSQIIQQLARISGMQPEAVATFLKSDGWRNLMTSQAQAYSQGQLQLQAQLQGMSQELKPVGTIPPPPIIQDESVKMELVSDCTLSPVEESNILAPPPAPPVIPPPPPLPMMAQPAMRANCWMMPPPQRAMVPQPVPLPPQPVPPPQPTPLPPQPSKPISLLSPQLMHNIPPPVSRPPPPNTIPLPNFKNHYAHIPPSSEPPRSLLSLPPISPPPIVPNISKPPPPIESKPEPSWLKGIQNMSWSNQGNWSESEINWKETAGPSSQPPQIIDIPVPPPPIAPPTDMVTKNLMNALGLGSKGADPPPPPLFQSPPPPLPPRGLPPRGRGVHPPLRGPSHRGGHFNGPPPPGSFPPGNRYQNVGNSSSFKKRGGGGGRPLKLQ